ncbi:hypothetical protein [Roseibium aggregatum]|uniref:hypothetical protein n=1 Tax=Roseibium aggregatum TaxID=187304 RepID=UPI001E53FD07|nr:hypothetical protein [Roseibium aggregatum]UES37644.1 hypothetical protein GFC08_07080 [Roseibium aggregatum]
MSTDSNMTRFELGELAIDAAILINKKISGEHPPIEPVVKFLKKVGDLISSPEESYTPHKLLVQNTFRNSKSLSPEIRQEAFSDRLNEAVDRLSGGDEASLEALRDFCLDLHEAILSEDITWAEKMKQRVDERKYN